MTARTVVGRAAICVALGGVSWIAQGCGADVDSDAEGRLGRVRLALDDLVRNPGEFEFELTDDSIFVFPNQTQILLGDPSAPYADFTAEVAASGAVSDVASNFFHTGSWTFNCPPNTLVTAEVRFHSDTTGVVDPGNNAIDLRQDATGAGGLIAWVHFTTNVPSSCDLDTFPVNASGLLNSSNCDGAGLGDTEFCLEAENIAVPVLGANDCGTGVGTCINNNLGLGSPGYMYLHGETTEMIVAP